MNALRFKQRMADRVERAADFIKNMFDFSPVLEPAFAGASGTLPRRPSMMDLDTRIMKFNTGPLPSARSPAGRIARWEPIEVLEAGKTPANKSQASFRDAQAAVSALRNNATASHEHITYEAAKLCSASNPIVNQYLLHLMSGSNAEDFIFAPGEDMESISHGDRGKIKGMTRRDFSALVAGKESSRGFFGNIFYGLRSAWNWVTGGDESDALNRPYFAHFYDQNQGGEGGLSILGGELKFQSALSRLKLYWNHASSYYIRGDMPRAFCSLGHALHLVQDLHVPAHVHNDIHGPTIILGKLDSLEEWCTKPGYPDIRRSAKEPNIRIWNSKPLKPPSPDTSWTYANVESKLEDFAGAIARESQRLRSVDYEGTDLSQRTTGKLSDDECFGQAEILIPAAIRDSAQLLANFLDYHQRQYQPG